jgi:hypothetical protein
MLEILIVVLESHYQSVCSPELLREYYTKQNTANCLVWLLNVVSVVDEEHELQTYRRKQSGNYVDLTKTLHSEKLRDL